jgi:hypothetical protein
MSFQKVCRVCNKFLKETKRSNALYCGKSCKNKALTLRKGQNVLNQLETPKTIHIEHPLYGAPNIYDLYKKGFELQGQLEWHQRHAKHIREIDSVNEEIRQRQLAISNEKQAIQEKLANTILFGFTDIINKLKDKPQSGLVNKNIKPQSGFMPLTSDDFADF